MAPCSLLAPSSNQPSHTVQPLQSRSSPKGGPLCACASPIKYRAWWRLSAASLSSEEHAELHATLLVDQRTTLAPLAHPKTLDQVASTVQQRLILGRRQLRSQPRIGRAGEKAVRSAVEVGCAVEVSDEDLCSHT